MSPKAPIPAYATRRRKVSIEIYFVLYLSAIILLLGTTPASHRNSREDQLEEVIRHLLVSDFKVKVEKAALLYSFIPAGVSIDTAGTQLRRDSLNVITARGTFSHVEFKIVSIEDSAAGTAVPVERARLLMTGERSAVFQWTPSSSDRNGVYRVTVAGFATPLAPASLSGDLREKVDEVLRRNGTVSDSVTFTINIFAVMDQAMLRRIVEAQAPSAGRPGGDTGAAIAALPSLTATPPGSPFNGQGFDLSVGNIELPVPAGRSWRNRINLAGGASMEDLDVSVTGGSASVVERTASFIVVGGMAPSGGPQQVTVTGKRRSDGRMVNASFTVRAVPASLPPVPDPMLLGESYMINFATGGLPAERVAVEVYENGKMILSKDEGRSEYRYQPGAAGTVRFVRYFDGQKLDEVESDLIPILPPVTKVTSQAERGATEATVVTQAYGKVNGQQNRAVLKIKMGNAEEPEQIDESFNQNTKQTTQTWRVRRKDRAKPFTFTAYAIDQRGSKAGKSSEVSFESR